MKNRRNFIKHSLIGACAASFNKNYPLSTGKIPDGYIIGHGNHQYKVHKTWGDLDPSKFPVHHCHEMVIDKHGRLFLCNTDVRNNILVYDRSGKLLDSWGNDFPGAHGLTINDEGGTEYLYLTDTVKHKVYKLTLTGNIIMTIDYPKEAMIYDRKEAFIPTETAIADNGDILVADGYGQDYILRYDSDGRLINYFGGKGSEPKNLKNAHGICIDNRGTTPTLLVTSRAEQSFKRYSIDGKYIETIHLPGCSICRPVIKGETLYFAVIVTKDWWSYDGMIAILDKENNVVSFPGGSGPQYKDGKLSAPIYDNLTFMNPHDVCIDNDENIYVPQWFSGKTYPIKLERI